MASNVTVVIAPKGAVETGDAIKGVAKKAEESAGPVGKLNDALGGMAKIAGGFVLGQGITSAPAAFMDMARAAAEDEASTKRVETAIHALSGNYTEHIGKVNEAIAAGQKKAFTDDETRDAVTKLALATGDTDEAMKRLAVAQDLARGANIPLADASRVLGKVTDENLQVFKRMGITLPNVASEADVLAAVQAKFAGQADQYANSTAGQFARAEDAISEAKEAIGYKLIPVMATAAEGALKLTDAFDAHVMPAIDKVAGVVGEAADAFGSLPTSTQQVAGGFAAMALAAGPALQGGQKLVGMVKELGEGSLGAGGKLTLLTAGLGALAVGVDVLLNKTTGAGLIDHVFGDVASIEAHGRALDSMNAALLAGGPGADKLAVATAQLAAAQRGLTEAGGAAIGSQSALSNALLGSDGRIFGFNVGLSDGIDKLKDYKEQVAVAADAMVRNGATLGQLREEYDKLDPTLKKVFDDHTHIEDALHKVEMANLDAAGASAAHRYALEHAGTAASEASPFIAQFTKELEGSKNMADDTAKALDGLIKTLADANPNVIQLQASNAFLNKELGDLKAQTEPLTAAEQARVKVLEDTIKRNDDLISGYKRNQDAVKGAQAELQDFLGPTGLGGLLTQLTALKVPGDDQVALLGKLSSAYQHMAANDVPGAIAQFNSLKSTLDPAIWNTIAQAIGPQLASGLVAGVNGPEMATVFTRFNELGADAAKGIIAGFTSQQSAVSQAFIQTLDGAIVSARAYTQTHSPSRLTAEKIGVPMAEGIAAGITEKAGLVRDVAVFTAQEAVDAANAIVTGSGAPMAAVPSAAGFRGGPGEDNLPNELGGTFLKGYSSFLDYQVHQKAIAAARAAGKFPEWNAPQPPATAPMTIHVTLAVDGAVLAQHIEQVQAMAMS